MQLTKLKLRDGYFESGMVDAEPRSHNSPRPAEFPWKVLFRLKGHVGYQCSGSLIKKCWVLAPGGF